MAKLPEVPPVVDVLATNIKKILHERKISGRKLAALTGHSVMRVNDLLNGRKTPGFDIVEDIANALGVGIDELRKRPTPRKRSA